MAARQRIAGFARIGDKLRDAKPARPKQAEMHGMETSLAAEILTAEKRRRERKSGELSKEDLFDFDLRRYSLPVFIRQHMFAKQAFGRMFKLDFANAQYMLAIEIEGLVVQRVHIATLDEHRRVRKIEPELICRGRHASISGFRDDCEKYALAAVLGWTVLRFEQSQVRDGTAIDLTQRVLAAKGWKR